MISYKRKFYFWKLKDNWFVYRYRASDVFSLVQYSYVKKFEDKPKFCCKDISYTVELPLDKPFEEIFAGFNSTNRTHIRRAEKEGVVCSFREDKDRFLEFFNDFAKLKGLFPARRSLIDEFGDHFVTSFAEHNGVLLAAHSYLVDKEVGIARLYQSCSIRLDDNVDKKLVAYANKLLTAEDARHFQRMGLKVLDFGGYAEGTKDKGLQGINEFKLSFGGQKVENTNYQSFLYYILRKISLLLDRRY